MTMNKEKSVLEKVEEFNNKEAIIKDLKTLIGVEINELFQLRAILCTTTIKHAIKQLEMTANRINFCISEYKNAT